MPNILAPGAGLTPVQNVRCRVWLSTATAIGNGVVIKYNNVEIDTNNEWNSTTGVWTCPVAGTYILIAQSKVGATSQTTNLEFLKNGTAITLSGNPVTNSYLANHLSAVVDLALGDTISVSTIQGFTPQIDTPGYGNYLHISSLASNSILNTAVGPVPSALMVRDSAGRAQVTDPGVAADIATKNYVDSQISNTARWHVCGDPGEPTLSTWSNYDGGLQYAPARFMRDNYNKVRLSGLITTGLSGVAFTMPSGYRPGGTIRFATCAAGDPMVWEINSSGQVIWRGGMGSSSTSYVSLNQIRFFDESISSQAWTTPALSNSFAAVSGYIAPRYCTDPFGNVHLSGMAKGGTAATMFTLPVGMRPDYPMSWMQVAADGFAVVRVEIETTGAVTVNEFDTRASNFAAALDGISFPPAGVGKWRMSNLTAYANSWVPYNAAGGMYAQYRVCKDDAGIVRYDGLIRSGTLNYIVAMAPGFNTVYDDIWATWGNAVSSGTGGMARLDTGTAQANLSIANPLLVEAYGTGAGNGFVFLDGIEFFGER